MTDPLDPIRPPGPEKRARERRSGDRRATPALEHRPALPVVVEAAPPPAPDPLEPADPTTAFAAQLLGQPGQKRGLRGGPETLERAREAYLGAEWLGPKDRRIPRGKAAKTEA
ncbi:MAG TPA: hypothetical protein VF559_09055 [Caulobacteraceae bacterium]|jgi:hypothetical protein